MEGGATATAGGWGWYGGGWVAHWFWEPTHSSAFVGSNVNGGLLGGFFGLSGYILHQG
jgi:hypothetical protein